MRFIPHEPVTLQLGTARRWRMLLYLLAPLVIGGLLYGAYRVIQPAPARSVTVFSSGLAAALTGGALLYLYGLLEAARWRLIVTPTRIISAGAFRTRELALDNVHGFRINEHYTYILPRWEGQSTLKISYTTEGYAGLQEWLAERFPRLDSSAGPADEAALLADSSLGGPEPERAARLTAARRASTALSIASALAAAWLLLRPEPYQWAVAAALLVPLLAAAALWCYPGLLRIDEAKGSPYPSVTLSLLLPGSALALRAIFDSSLISYAPLWPVAAAVTAGFALLLAGGSQVFLQRPSSRLNASVALLIGSLVYGYGATTAANVAFDYARPTVYLTKVLGKHSSSGKTTTYYLTLAPWGPLPVRKDVTVKAACYRRTPAGSTVRILLRPGGLGIPWYTVAE